MKVILLKDVPKVGRKFDIKDVSDGYGNNFIIRNKLGVIATKEAIENADKMRNQFEADIKSKEAGNVSKLESFAGLSIESKANEEGHLFAGIKKDEVLSKLADAGIVISEESLIMNKPIKETGEQSLDVKIGDKKLKLKVTVKSA